MSREIYRIEFTYTSKGDETPHTTDVFYLANSIEEASEKFQKGRSTLMEERLGSSEGINVSAPTSVRKARGTEADRRKIRD